MSGEEKINIRIKKDVGITQALKQLVKDAGENVKGSVWNATLDKLVELNNQRETDNKGSIFSGGTERNDWHRNFVVHEGNIEFSKTEMEALLDTMQVSEGVKNRILGEAAPAAGTEPPAAGTEPPPAGTEPPAAGTETPPTGEGKTSEEIEELAHEKGYRGTEHAGTFYDEKTKTHYQWDNKTGDFKARPDIKQINEDGSYIDQQGVEHAADVAETPPAGTETPAAGVGKTPEEIAQAAQEKGYRATNHAGTFYDEKTKTHYQWDDEAGDFKALPDVRSINKDGTYTGTDNKLHNTNGTLFTGERVTANEDETVVTTETYKEGVFNGKEVVTINEDKSYKKEIYDKDNKLVKTENYNAEGKLTSSVEGSKTTTVEYSENGSVWTEKEGEEVKKVTKRDSDGRIIEEDVTASNVVSTYSYKEDNSYTVTTKYKQNGKLVWISDYNSEGLEVRRQEYDEGVLQDERKYTYRQDGTRIADIEYYNATLERDSISEQKIELKQDDTWCMVSYISKSKGGKYNVDVDMNMKLQGSTSVGDQRIVAIETEEEAKALQEELLGLRELYSEIAYYDKDGEWRAEPEISDERKAEIITKLTETISNKDKPLEVRQAAAFAATYGRLYDDETLQNAIIDTNDSAIINRLDGIDLKPEQWEKIYNMALRPEFRKSGGYNDVYRMLIGAEANFSLNTPDEIKFKAFNNLPRTWSKDGNAYGLIPQLPVAFLNEHMEEIKPEDKFYLYARSEGEMDKETFDTNFIPSIPANPTGEQVDKIRETIEHLPEDVRGDYHLIESGDRFYNIIMNRILANPSIIEALGKKTDWDDARKKEAINEYINDFGDDIAKQLGIDDPSKIQPGQIFDFSKVKWPQPSGLNWFFNY